MMFTNLASKLLKKDVLVFLDLEGSQFAHDPISIGMIAYKRSDSLSLSSEVLRYRSLIKTKSNIGSLVKRMTGITREMLKETGKGKEVVFKEVINLLRPYSSKAFIAYGEQDLKMLRHFISEEDYTFQYYSHIVKNYFDFHKYIQSLCKSISMNSLSLNKLATIFNIKNDKEHDSFNDALTLSEVYSAFVEDEERTLSLFQEYFQRDVEPMRELL